MKQEVEFINDLKFRTVYYYDGEKNALKGITYDDDGLIIA